METVQLSTEIKKKKWVKIKIKKEIKEGPLYVE